ncbi:hypothetical protein AGOR_G00027820 [Albula goreensis]|uniref:Uncharacterized protein n=1 Tax=Albula goreensis TaxID=1534307 RepID=A0A8T3E1Z2_9TELE|nr:hypothetical protein AGOR_G00027820 [Albula goreensis]
MGRDAKIVSALKTLGYPSNTCVNVCVCQELPCPLVSWLVGELRGTCPEVHKGNRQGNVVSAVLGGELRALLEELHCPYTALSTETLTPELLNTATEFLVGELLAERILQYRKHHPEDTLREDNTEKEKREGEDRGVGLEGEGRGGDGAVWDKEGEADIREEIVQLFQVLSLGPSSQLSDAYTEVESRITLLPGGTVAEPLLKTTLNSEQWRKLEQITLALAKDYECRRDMMTKRFQVTLQSFEWGEKGPERSAALSSVQPLSPPSLVPVCLYHCCWQPGRTSRASYLSELDRAQPSIRF